MENTFETIRFLLIDDERLALILLEKELRTAADTFGENIEVGTLQEPEFAAREVGALRPDVVFLDIHMPEVSGLQIAEMLQEKHPDVMIVFMTAHDIYALEAFELNAIDYVLKPLVRDRLEKTFKRIVDRRRTRVMDVRKTIDDGRKMIMCSRTLLVRSGDAAPELPKWRTTKAQELFAYLLLRRGETVHKSTILELFFPEMDVKSAMTRLYTTIYQIRQCVQSLELDITIQNVSMQEGYILRVGDRVTIETEVWEKELLAAAVQNPPRYERIGELLAGYDGGYLRDHDYVWAEHEQMRLSKLWADHARELALRTEELGHYDEALKLYVRMQELDPYQEAEGLAVLRLYDRMGQYDKVIAYSIHLEKLFKDELGLPLPPTIAAWRDDWRARTEAPNFNIASDRL